jgi:hypothetical protein
MYYKLICILYALLCGQNFILVKSGCYTAVAAGSWASTFYPIAPSVAVAQQLPDSCYWETKCSEDSSC